MNNCQNLILANTSDFHSFAVIEALERLGADVAVFLPELIGKSDEVSIDYNSIENGIIINDRRVILDNSLSVLCRRFPIDYVTPEWSHPADGNFLREQAKNSFFGLTSLLDSCFMINPVKSSLLSSSKLNQLKCAKSVGLAVPDSIISNSPNQVKDFISSFQDVCVKPITGYVWKADGVPVSALTSRITLKDIDDDRQVSSSVMIYQRFVHKIAEYRLTIFGNYHVSTRLENDDEGDNDDWRVSHTYLRRLSVGHIPENIIFRCKKLMDILGLRFGTFDLIETADGQFVFLEVNESGSFLWQEEYCDDVHLLEPFARYMISKNDAFTWSKDLASSELSLASCASDAAHAHGYDDGIIKSQSAISRYYFDESTIKGAVS